MGNWLSIATIIYLGIMILYGHYRGFIRLAVSAVALIATLFVVQVAMPQVTGFLKENTDVYHYIESGVRTAMGLEEETDIQEPALQRVLIENMSLPGQLKESLLENNNNEVYQVLGVERFTDYVSGYLANSILNIAGFIILFLLVFVTVNIIAKWLNLVAKLPILSGINKLAGALLGAVEGIFVLWFLCLVLTFFAGTHLGGILITQIKMSAWLSYIYDNNFLGTLVMMAVKNIL